MNSAEEDTQRLLPHGTVRILDETRKDDLILLPEPTDSPNDPLNWSLSRKIWSSSIVLFITALTAATSNSFGAAGTALQSQFNISFNQQNTAAGVLFLGIGYGTLALSSAPWLYGRRIAYLICLAFSIIGNAMFGKITGAGLAIGSQLFVGGSEAVAEAHVQLSLFDLFFQHQRGLVLGLYVFAISVGTFLGPLISGYIADSPLNWPWIGWFAAIISAGTLVITYFGLEETAFDRTAYLNKRRDSYSAQPAPAHARGSDHQSEKPRGLGEVDTYVGQGPQHRQWESSTYWQRIALITPAPNVVGLGIRQYFMRMWNNVRIIWFPAVLYAGIQWGFQDAWLTFYLTTENNNYTSDPYNYGDARDSIMTVPTLIGSIIGCIYGGYISDVFVKQIAKRNNGIYEAEQRLWLMIPPAILCPIGLIIFGFGTYKVWPWQAAYVALGFIGFGWGCAGDLSLAYAMDAYPDMVLEGMVGVSVINNTLACIFTFVCSDWMDVNSVAEVFTVVGIIAFVIMLPLTLFMIWYGKRLRVWSTPSYEKFLAKRT